MARLRMDRAQLALLSCRSGMLPILLHAACDASRIVHCISASAARRVVCCLPKRHVPMPLFAVRARDETREHHSVAPRTYPAAAHCRDDARVPGALRSPVNLHPLPDRHPWHGRLGVCTRCTRSAAASGCRWLRRCARCSAGSWLRGRGEPGTARLLALPAILRTRLVVSSFRARVSARSARPRCTG